MCSSDLPDQALVWVQDAVFDMPQAEVAGRLPDGRADGLQIIRVQSGKGLIGIVLHLFRRYPLNS